MALIVNALQPAFADQHNHDGAWGNPFVDYIGEVLARANGVDVDENEVASKVGHQGIVEPAYPLLSSRL
jgi:hypothetical protein